MGAVTGDRDARPDLGRADGEAVFERLFDLHAGPLHGYLCARVGRSVADDLVGETFLVAFRDRVRYDPERGEVRAWLYGIATNLASRHHRGEQRGLAAAARLGAAGDCDVDGPGRRVPEQVDAAVRVRTLAAALAALPAGDRDVLLLTAWAGLSSAEVAQALEIPVGTVRSRLHRVRGQLRRRLDEREEPR